MRPPLRCAARWQADRRADYYAFRATQGHFATLALNGASCSLTNSSGSDCISTNGFQGWVESGLLNFAGAAGNTKYIAGLFNGANHDNFFGFDLAERGSITSAALVIYSGVISTELTYSLNSLTGTGLETALQVAFTDKSTTISSPNTSFYDDIEGGEPYTTYAIDPSSPTVLDISLNGLAVRDINAAIQNGSGFFAIGGSVTPDPPIFSVPPPLPTPITVPEPSTWVMMLAGFAGIGFARRRRPAKLGRARSAG